MRMAAPGVIDYVATPLVAAAYVGFVLATRQQLMRASYEALGAYIEGVCVAHPRARPELKSIHDDASLPSRRRWLRRLVGLSDSRILAAWRVARTVELNYAHELPREQTTERLRSLAATLSGDEHPARRELSARIRKLVDPPTPEPEPSKEELDALLQEAMRQEFDIRDTLYESLAFENQRATWLAYAGLAFVSVLAVVAGHAELFLAGAVGGLLSRLARVLGGRPLPNDYGASWGPLVLSPVAGALAGWLGVLVLGALSDGGLSILAPSLKVSWRFDPGGQELGLAFLFGFSERLFTSTVTSTTEKLLPSSEAPLAPAPPAAKAPPA